MSSPVQKKSPFLKGIKELIRRTNSEPAKLEETSHEVRSRQNRLNHAALEIFCPVNGEDFLNGSFPDIEVAEVSSWQVLVEKEKTLSKKQGLSLSSKENKSRPKAESVFQERTNHKTMSAAGLKSSKSEDFSGPSCVPSDSSVQPLAAPTALPKVPPRPSTLRGPPQLPARPAKSSTAQTIEPAQATSAEVIEPSQSETPALLSPTAGRVMGKPRVLSPGSCRPAYTRPAPPPRPTARSIYSSEPQEKSLPPVPPVPLRSKVMAREASARLLAAFNEEKATTPEEAERQLQRVLDILSRRMGFPVKTEEHALQLINMAGFNVKTLERAESVVSTLQSDSSFYSGGNYHSRDNFHSNGDFSQ